MMERQDAYSEASVSRNDRAAGAGAGQSHAINKPSRRPDGNVVQPREDSMVSGASNKVRVPSRRNMRAPEDDRQRQMAQDLSDLDEESESSRNEKRGQ